MIKAKAMIGIIVLSVLSPLAMAGKCKTELTFENKLAGAIKIKEIRVGYSKENTGNMRIDVDARKSTNSRRIFGNLVNKPLKHNQVQEGIYVHFKIWEPHNNRWVGKKIGPFQRTCRDGGNMFFRLDTSRNIFLTR